MELIDPFGRTVRDLRISITDRCNFRCTYCMPAEGMKWLPREEVLTYEELHRVASICVSHFDVDGIRLTGGEPTMRAHFPVLINNLSALHVPATANSPRAGKPIDLAVTTNGATLRLIAQELHDSGLRRINISLDTLKKQRFLEMTRRDELEHVLDGIDAAIATGFSPVKINVVVQRGVNDSELLTLCEYFRARGHAVRFIEFMDVGNTNHWSVERVVPAKEIVERIGAKWPLAAVGPAYRGEVAARYRYLDGRGEIGIISSVTEPFCRDCHRARLSADGKLFTCLFASLGWDVLGALRAGADAAGLETYLSRVWGGRLDRYSDERAELIATGEARAKIEMSYIGG